MRSDLLGTFEQVVLLALRQLGDDAGVPDLRARVAEVLERSVPRGAVYVTVDRLERRGLVASRYEEAAPARGGRPRRFVTVTSTGCEALCQARRALDRAWDGVSEAGVP